MQAKKVKIWLPDRRFYNEHITFTSVGVIKEMLNFLALIKVSYFTFDRTYKDGSHIRLTSAGEWIEHYYKEKLYDVAIFEKTPETFSRGYILWAWLKRDPIYSEAALYNIDHGLTITQPHKSYCDFYHFGYPKDEFVLAAEITYNLHYLYKFIALFQEKAYQLILKADKTRFILPTSSQPEIHLSDIIRTNKKPHWYELNEIKRLYLGEEYANCYLTSKEIKILSCLKKGHKIVEIATELTISSRTAETHINNIKDKLKCSTLFELGFVANNLGIHNLF